MTSNFFNQADIEFGVQTGTGWDHPDSDVLQFFGNHGEDENTVTAPQRTVSSSVADTPVETIQSSSIESPKPLRNDKRFSALQASCDILVGDNVPLDIITKIFDISFEGVCCLHGIKCSNYGKLPIYEYRRDGRHHEVNVYQHGEFIIGKTYDIYHTKENAFKYDRYYVPLFKKCGEFIGYTCHEDYEKYHSDKYRYWNENVGLQSLKNIGIFNGRHCTSQNRRCCHICRAVESENNYKCCFICGLNICKIRCKKNIDLNKEFQLCIFNKNISRGLWKKFQVLIYDNNDNETELIQYLCERCIKNGSNRDTLAIANYKFGQYVEVYPSNLYGN